MRHGIRRTLNDWPYSNYLEWTGQRSGKLVDAEFVASRFADPIDYESFVIEGLRMSKLPEELEYLDEFEALGK